MAWRGSGRPQGKKDVLNKRIPENPKFRHVKARVDTGNSLTKYLEKLEEIRKNYRYRPGEIFKRIKVSTFTHLVLQVASLAEEIALDCDGDGTEPEAKADALKAETESMEDVKKTRETEGSASNKARGDETSRSTLKSLIHGVGEMDTLVKEPEFPPSPRRAISSEALLEMPYTNCPYLLLDLRDSDAYKQCHIIGAYNYPSAMLSRSCNQYSKEILQYKNYPGKIIVVYDEDERIAPTTATILCEHGLENIYMLSGGLKVLAQRFPWGGMTTGNLPISCLPSSALGSGRKKSQRKSWETTRPVQAAGTQCRFKQDDLDLIAQQLEQIIGSDLSSKLSTNLSWLVNLMAIHCMYDSFVRLEHTCKATTDMWFYLLLLLQVFLCTFPSSAWMRQSPHPHYPILYLKADIHVMGSPKGGTIVRRLHFVATFVIIL
uniref:Centrosomal protein 41 n=1 Tax=Eptatretus burgeri TaxID=7764 RepID=A0A8C4Q4S4_EPTBU